jgi:membrane protease YdiL (CAAX protease family)
VLPAFLVIFAVFEGTGFALAGAPTTVRLLTVSAVVICTVLVVQHLLTGDRGRSLIRSVGLRRSDRRTLVTALVVAAVLVACYPLLAAVTGARFGWPVAPLAILGVYAQNGVAEEMLMRGFLYRHLRRGRGAGRAVLLVVVIHAAAHALLIPVVGFGVAAAAMAVAALLALPYAVFFDRSGGSIWPVAVLHGTADTVMLVVPSSGTEHAGTLQALLIWFALIALVPYAVFLVPHRSPSGSSS